MSKYSEVLNKSQIGFGDTPTVPPPVDASATPAPVAPSAPPAAPSTPPPQAAAAPAPDPTPSTGYRRVSFRVNAASPVLPFDEDSRAGEQYRLLRTKIVQHPRQPRLIVVSSAGPGDGKSTTAMNLAGVLALKDDAPVVLIDADFRRSMIANQLGIPSSPGLAEFLAGTAELRDVVVQSEEFPQLHIITAGEPLRNPGELLDSARWQAACARLRSTFRYMVIDSPPIAAVADYDLLAASSDGVVVVARPDHTNKELCFKALDAIPKDKLLGVVLNCVPDWFLGDRQDYDGYYPSATERKA